MNNEVKILDRDEISQKILRLSWEIYENNFEENEIFLFGVGEKGHLIAKKISEKVAFGEYINKLPVSIIKTSKELIAFNNGYIKPETTWLICCVRQ